MRTLAVVLLLIAAGCATGRGSTERGMAYLRTLGELAATADSTGNVRDWARVASFAATPPTRMTSAERVQGCIYAMRADSLLRAALYHPRDGLHVRGYDVVFYVDEVRIAQPDSTREAAVANLGCS